MANLLGDLADTVTGTVSSLADAYVKYNTAAQNVGLSSANRTIDELKGTVSVLQQQMQANAIANANAAAAQNTGFGLDNSFVKWGLVIGGLFLAYKVLK